LKADKLKTSPSWVLKWVAVVTMACAGMAHAQSRLCQSYSGMPSAVTVAKSTSGKAPAGMVAIKGGRFVMGSERFYPEERPRKTVEVGPFYIQQHEVTNAQFAAIVKATG
jgi:formylglycine-generating enzyme required for sulfatase activity